MAAETILHQEPEGGTSVAAVFHSASGHVRKLAHHVAAAAAERRDVTVELHDIEVIDQRLWDALAPVDAVVFGCPTYMGGPSSVFKRSRKPLSRSGLASGATRSPLGSPIPRR